MRQKKTVAWIFTMAFIMALCLSACAPDGSKPDAAEDSGAVTPNTEVPLAAPRASFVPFDTEGLLVAPVPVSKGADQLTDVELMAIYEEIAPQASRAFRCEMFELDKDDAFMEGGVQYIAITNFTGRDDVTRNYTALFSYELFQDTIFPVLFLLPMGGDESGSSVPSILYATGDKLYLSINAAAFVGGPGGDDIEVIYKSADRFKLRWTFEWIDGTTQPYVQNIVNQNGIWVLDNYYWYDIIESKYI